MKDASNVLFENVDCVHLRVASLDDGLKFYRDTLGLKLLWRADEACGLGTENGSTEIVLSTNDLVMVDIKVRKVEEILARFVEAGDRVEEGPFVIDVGRCAMLTVTI